jgi:hypothetical protein
MHETALRMSVPGGFGLAGIVHSVPSHPAMSVWFASPARCDPTATHAVSAMHDVAENPDMNERLGLGRSDHVARRRRTSVSLPSPW